MPSPVRLMVLRYCLGMIMSVSTLIIWSGAATPSSLVNLSIKEFLGQRYCPSHGGSGSTGQARLAQISPPGNLGQEMRGNADVDCRSGQQDLGYQAASGHRGGDW